MAKFSDNDFIQAVRATEPKRGQMERVAEAVGCSQATVLKRLKKIAAESPEILTMRLEKAYDKQPGMSWSFGGAGVCVRKFYVAAMTDQTERDAQFVAGLKARTA